MTRRLKALAGTTASVPITLFGLILVTFLIGRVVPIDPVIAIVGDHAPPDVIARTRVEPNPLRPSSHWPPIAARRIPSAASPAIVTKNHAAGAVADCHRQSGVVTVKSSTRAYFAAMGRIGTGILQISAPPAGRMKKGSRRFARASA